MAISRHGLRRTLGAVAFGLTALGVACSFPDHTFIEDNEFYGLDGGGAVGGGGTSGTGAVGGGGTAGSGASGGGGTAGDSGVGGTAGTAGTAGGGGTGNTGGSPDGGNCPTGTHQCAPAPPSGWTGPAVYYEGPTPAPGCNESGGFPAIKQTANSGFVAGSAACPTCNCGAATGMACNAEIILFDGPACGGSGCWGGQPYCGGSTLTVSTACQPQSLCTDSTGALPKSAVFTNAVAAGGTCASSSTGTKTITPPSFTNTVRVCGGAIDTNGGCPSGSVCQPKPTSPFSSNICIYKTGDTSCPAGAYSSKSIFYVSSTDDRDCSACSCGSPTGTCAGASVELFTDGVCQAGKSTLPTADLGGCTDLVADSTPIVAPNCSGFAGVSLSKRLLGTPSGSCTSSGGQVTGSAAPSEPITFCCL